MIKMIALLVRKQDMTHEEFVEHYRETHCEFGAALPHVKRYSTAVPIDPPGRLQHNEGGHMDVMEMNLTEFDGISTLHYESYDDYVKSVNSEEYEAALEDELNLISDVYFVLVDNEVHVDETGEETAESP